jgi:hypothetical protein
MEKLLIMVQRANSSAPLQHSESSELSAVESEDEGSPRGAQGEMVGMVGPFTQDLRVLGSPNGDEEEEEEEEEEACDARREREQEQEEELSPIDESASMESSGCALSPHADSMQHSATEQSQPPTALVETFALTDDSPILGLLRAQFACPRAPQNASPSVEQPAPARTIAEWLAWNNGVNLVQLPQEALLQLCAWYFRRTHA